MEPVVEDTHGYRVKSEYQHLMPVTLGRPQNHLYTPYCLPEYDEMYQAAMDDIEKMNENERKYYGAYNSTLQN